MYTLSHTTHTQGKSERELAREREAGRDLHSAEFYQKQDGDGDSGARAGSARFVWNWGLCERLERWNPELQT